MRTTNARSSLLAALACAALAAVSAPSASAGTGGVAATPASSGARGALHLALATWFGPGFYGHQTACGQVLVPSLVGVANRTLPCGTLVEVSYAGRRLTVPVVDRGPYGSIGAAWDLTGGAAKALRITETVHIRAHVVGQVSNSPSLGLPAPLPTPVLAAGPATAVTGGVSAS
jgi:rare lipoprotein A (peptidoglycan hydrolase)